MANGRSKGLRRAAPALLAGLVVGGFTRESDDLGFGGATMGTTYSVKVGGLPPRVGLRELQAGVEAHLERVNDLMSTYRETSELSRFNAAQTGEWFPVAEETAAVARAAVRISRLTQGAFDPTIGPLVELWGFGAAGGRAVEPPEGAIAEALRSVGHDKVEVRDQPPALRKTSSAVRLDFSAIAKGYAVDRVAEYLGGRGVRDHFVEIGGEVRVAGRKASGRRWRLGLEKPLAGERSVDRVLELEDVAMATSGDYRNFFEVDGRRFGHTLDPRLGRPVRHRLAAVSVVRPSCMEADALATALMVLGPKSGYDLAEAEGYAALFLVREAEGEFAELSTRAFRRLLEETR